MKKTVNLATVITEDLKEKLNQMAAERRWTISSTICFIIEEYFKAQNTQK